MKLFLEAIVKFSVGLLLVAIGLLSERKRRVNH